MRDRLLSLVTGAALAIGSTLPAWSADYYGPEPTQQMYSDALVPSCDDSKVLAAVEDQFEHGAVEMLQTGVVIEEFAARRQRDLGAVVAPHAIDSDGDHAGSARCMRRWRKRAAIKNGPWLLVRSAGRACKS